MLLQNHSELLTGLAEPAAGEPRHEVVYGLELEAPVEPVVDGVAVNIDRCRELVTEPVGLAVSGVEMDNRGHPVGNPNLYGQDPAGNEVKKGDGSYLLPETSSMARPKMDPVEVDGEPYPFRDLAAEWDSLRKKAVDRVNVEVDSRQAKRKPE